MYKAFGIVSSSGRNIYVDGMQDYRPIGAFSFLGRYRVIDFPISNMTNSDIDRIQVYINNKPRSVVEHVGTGRHICAIPKYLLIPSRAAVVPPLLATATAAPGLNLKAS